MKVYIGDDGATAIADGIRENVSSSLNAIDLSRNNIGIVGASSIATMLMTSKSLDELFIGQNDSIGRAGVVTIVKSLKHNKVLTWLALNDGLGITSTLLGTNFSLKILDVSSTTGVDGAIKTINAMKTNKSLKYLSLMYNPTRNCAFIKEIAAMLQINTTLTGLGLWFLGATKPINDVARIILKTLDDRNDTVAVHIDLRHKHSDELRLMLKKIQDIGAENRRGSRSPPFKCR